MVKAWEAARQAARKAQEATYEGLCTVIEYQDVTNPVTKCTHEEEVLVLENQPCKLSFEKLDSAAQSETANGVSQMIKLFLAPEIQVQPGSKLIVTQNNITEEYAESGKPAVYATHQEIPLTLWKERA
jgi:hypothetical protein